jgi:ELWxxDGT repeat protein
MVKDINSGSSGSHPDQLTAVGNTLYFQATDGEFANGSELWKSDGTASGTVMVKDINSEGSSSPYDLTAVGNTLYFRASDRPNGIELWKSDGTAAGTVLAMDIWLGTDSSNPYLLTAVGNTLYFTAMNINNGREVYFDGFVTTEITYS